MSVKGVMHWPTRSVAFWISIAFALFAISVFIGTINNNIAVHQIVAQNVASGQESKCRVGSQIELEVANAQVARLVASLAAAQSKLIDDLVAQSTTDIATERVIVNDLRVKVEGMDPVIDKAITDRNNAVTTCKANPNASGTGAADNP